MSNCQDDYCATFRNYPSLLLHEEEQATRSQWERRRVKDLWVEPLDKKAPLYSDLLPLPEASAATRWRTPPKTWALPCAWQRAATLFGTRPTKAS